MRRKGGRRGKGGKREEGRERGEREGKGGRGERVKGRGGGRLKLADKIIALKLDRKIYYFPGKLFLLNESHSPCICIRYISLHCSSLVLIPCAEMTTSLELITCTSPSPHMGEGDRSNQHSSHMTVNWPALTCMLSFNKSVNVEIL